MVLCVSPCYQDGGSLDQVQKEARRIPEEILGKVSIAVSVFTRMISKTKFSYETSTLNERENTFEQENQQ